MSTEVSMTDGDEKVDEPAKIGTVLIVEDDPLIRERLVKSFRTRSAYVLEAASVAAAKRRLAEEIVDLVILDVRLGEDSGVEVARAAVSRSPAPAVLAVSGDARPEEAFELAQLGVRAFLSKAEVAPFLDRLAEVAHRLAREVPPLAPIAKAQVGSLSAKEVDEAVRQAMLEQALGLASGNHAVAARHLGVTRQAVQQRISRRSKK